MVEYRVSRDLLSCVVVRSESARPNDSLFERTTKNLNKMISEGRPCRVVTPVRPLDKSEIEQYRRYFCKKAKEDKCNYIYYTVPVRLFKREDNTTKNKSK